MVTPEQNERWTRVGPGTPCGELLRRYWQPLCPSGEVTEEKPTKRVRVMGEDLVVFRMPDGTYGCIEETCAHRGTSLNYGFVEDGGIRCCYHGWKYDCTGQCVEQPFEAQGGFAKEVKLKAYPVQKLGGLLFTYMGPDPAKAPLLPRWDVIVRTDGQRSIRVFKPLECNWLQAQENTCDATHTYYLHGHMSFARKLNMPGAEFFHRPIARYDWEYCEWGLDKWVEYGGDNPELEIRPPVIFPNILRIPVSDPTETIHWRVPVDDGRTQVFWVDFVPSKDPNFYLPEDADVPFAHVPPKRTADGDYDLNNFYTQDEMAWETQGAIFDRSRERLGVSDRGIVMFRKILEEQISRVERGDEPDIAVVRDPAKNLVIEFPGHTLPLRGKAESVVEKIAAKKQEV